jgi:hypothetical protein
MKKRAMKAWFVGLTMLALLGLLASASLAQVDGGLATQETVTQGDETSATAPEKKSYVFLPLVTYVGIPPSLPFSEDFGPDMSPDWQVFTRPGGPFANDWKWRPQWQQPPRYFYWPGEIGEEGRWTQFALSMLLGEDRQTWTDYEVVATIRDDYRRGDKGLTGLWFRGTYQDGVIGGYYVHMKPADNPPHNSNKLFLWRFPPGSRTLDDAELLQSFQYPGDIKFLNPYQMKVQVQGDRIRVWLKHNLEPESDYVMVFDVKDGTYSQGTIGLSAYKSMSFYYSVVVNPLSANNQ